MLMKIIFIAANPIKSIKIFINKFKSYFITKHFIGISNNRSDSDDGLYVAFVKEAIKNHNKFKNFKRNPHYNSILEHTTKVEGKQYLEIIKNTNNELLDKIELFKQNDIIGNPIKYNYDEFGKISPSTLRYMKVASDLKIYFGENLGNNLVEIGCGYGGQLLILDKIFHIDTYLLIDLPPVLELASIYLECHSLNLSYNIKTLNKLSNDKKYDLVISNYAFSELPKHIQLKYIKKVIANSKKGYLTMNSGKNITFYNENRLTLKEIQNLIPNAIIVEEFPLTSPENYIIIWGQHL